MFRRSLGLAVGTAAVVSALSESSSPAAVIITREIDVNITTSTSSITYSSALSTKTSELDIAVDITTNTSATASSAATSILPSKREKFFTLFYENRTSGLEVDNKVDAYVNWLLEPGFALPSASPGNEVSLFSSNNGELFPDLDETPGELFPELNPNKQKEPEKILPGTCEFKLRKLMQDGLQPAYDLYVRRRGEKRKIEDVMVNQASRDLQSLEGDQVWLLRYYIRCCTRNSGRGAFSPIRIPLNDLNKRGDPMPPPNGNPMKGDHPIASPPPKGNVMRDMYMKDTTKPQPPTGPDPDKLLGSDYDATKPLHDKDLEVNTPCEQKLLHYQHWTNTYLSWAGATDKFIKEELPKLKSFSDDPEYKSRFSRAEDKRNRLVEGIGRCCKDSPKPGPAPLGGNPFPSVPQEKPFVREL